MYNDIGETWKKTNTRREKEETHGIFCSNKNIPTR